MPPAIPFIAGAVTSAMGLSMTTAVIVGAVAGAVVAAVTGQNILMGALMGGLGGAGGYAASNALGFAGSLGGGGAPAADVAASAAGSSTGSPLDFSSIGSGTASGAQGAAGPANAITPAKTFALEPNPMGSAIPAIDTSGGSTMAGGLGDIGNYADGTGLLKGGPAATDLFQRTGGSGIIPSDTGGSGGLLDNFQGWVKDNPDLANGMVQTVGSGLQGMMEADQAEQDLIYKRELDAETRRNASFGKVPTTQWQP